MIKRTNVPGKYIVYCSECKYAHQTNDGGNTCEMFDELYFPPDFFCAAGIRKSPITLRVLSLSEIKQADVLYLEISYDEFSSCIPAKYHDSNNVDMEFYIGEGTVSKISLNIEYYNITWRCWNRHPAE